MRLRVAKDGQQQLQSKEMGHFHGQGFKTRISAENIQAAFYATVICPLAYTARLG